MQHLAIHSNSHKPEMSVKPQNWCTDCTEFSWSPHGLEQLPSAWCWPDTSNPAGKENVSMEKIFGLLYVINQLYSLAIFRRNEKFLSLVVDNFELIKLFSHVGSSNLYDLDLGLDNHCLRHNILGGRRMGLQCKHSRNFRNNHNSFLLLATSWCFLPLRSYTWEEAALQLASLPRRKYRTHLLK